MNKVVFESINNFRPSSRTIEPQLQEVEVSKKNSNGTDKNRQTTVYLKSQLKNLKRFILNFIFKILYKTKTIPNVT